MLVLAGIAVQVLVSSTLSVVKFKIAEDDVFDLSSSV